MSLINGTLSDAIEALAKRAADLRTRPLTFAEKRANTVSDYLSSIGQWAKDNPMAAGGIAGGLGGGLLGGLGTANANRGKDKRERRSVLNAMLMGGVSGAALGGGAGAAYKGIQGLSTPANTPAADIQRRIREIQDENPTDAAVRRGVTGALSWVREKLPVSTYAVPGAMAADAAMNSRTLNLGRFGLGRLDPGLSKDTQHLIRGMAAEGKNMNVPADIQAAVTTGQRAGRGTNAPTAAQHIVNKMRQRGPASSPVFTGRTPPPHAPAHLTRETARNLSRIGYGVVEGANPRGLYNIGGRQFSANASPLSGKWQALARLGYIAGIPAAEYLTGVFRDQGNREQQMQELATQPR